MKESIKITRGQFCWNVLLNHKLIASYLTETQAIGFVRRFMMPCGEGSEGAR